MITSVWRGVGPFDVWWITVTGVITSFVRGGKNTLT